VKIRSFAHRGLKLLYEEGGAKGVPPDTVEKLRKMMVYLENIDDIGELRLLTAWKAHTLTGNRQGVWSLTVTRNRRLTFRIDTTEREVCDLNLEDYH
jgi:proteic killer suppression protein